MSPPRDPFYQTLRRRALAKQGLCIFNPAHGQARPMCTTCAACGRKIKLRNDRRNPLRKRTKES